MPAERLQKILSASNVCSRRQAEKLILAGEVSINGQVVSDLGYKADLEKDQIVVSGQRITQKETHLYYKFNKPRGLISSKSDDLNRKTIYQDLNLPQSVNSAGRLDKESEGLMILTNDGEMLKRLTHPRYELSKTYHVKVFPKFNDNHLRALINGVEIDRELLKAFSARKLVEKGENWLEIVLKEGKKREIRKLLAHFDYHVKRLIRVSHGSVQLKKLRTGELIKLSEKEIADLRCELGLK